MTLFQKCGTVFLFLCFQKCVKQFWNFLWMKKKLLWEVSFVEMCIAHHKPFFNFAIWFNFIFNFNFSLHPQSWFDKGMHFIWCQSTALRERVIPVKRDLWNQIWNLVFQVFGQVQKSMVIFYVIFSFWMKVRFEKFLVGLHFCWLHSYICVYNPNQVGMFLKFHSDKSLFTKLPFWKLLKYFSIFPEHSGIWMPGEDWRMSINVGSGKIALFPGARKMFREEY